MTGEVVVSFFKVLAKTWIREPIQIELLPSLVTSPMNGIVGWDEEAKGWRIVVAERRQGRDLLSTLFHELRHILAKGDGRAPWRTIQNARDLMTGADTLGARMEREKVNKIQSQSRERKEDDADAWAEIQTQKWWPVLECVMKAVEEAVEQYAGNL